MKHSCIEQGSLWGRRRLQLVSTNTPITPSKYAVSLRRLVWCSTEGKNGFYKPTSENLLSNFSRRFYHVVHLAQYYSQQVEIFEYKSTLRVDCSILVGILRIKDQGVTQPPCRCSRPKVTVWRHSRDRVQAMKRDARTYGWCYLWRQRQVIKEQLKEEFFWTVFTGGLKVAKLYYFFTVGGIMKREPILPKCP